ncbi:MAG: outer membrane protein transport protein [Deltaproteobacteria bacterium]|nr:outer membrane protein transport protein [Deltaproteobacteria bacterium]
MKLKFWMIIFCVPTLLGVGNASAVLDYGFGSQTSVVGNYQRVSKKVVDAYSYVMNPSRLGELRKPYVSFGFLGTYGDFLPIKDVVIGNHDTGKEFRIGDVSTDYDETLGGSFALVLPLREKWPHIAFGCGGFLPFGDLMKVKLSSLNYIPSYPMYDGRTQRPSILASLGLHPFPNFYVGFGTNFYFTQTAQAYLDLNPDNPGQIINMQVRNNVSPLVSLSYITDDLAMSFNYRGKSDYKTETLSIADVNASLDGKTASLPTQFILNGSSFYDPHEVELGVGLPLWKKLSFSSSLTWQMWALQENPLGQFESSIGSSAEDFKYRDTVVAKIGLNWNQGIYSLRSGYFYSPTHVPDQSDSNLNILDTNKHVFTLGAGFQLDSILGAIDHPMGFDLHMQYHALEEKQVDKIHPDQVGGGGYRIGGRFFTYGLSMSMEL